MPAISILVATRNRKESLARLIDTMRELSRVPSWELIVVDNGSTDSTAALLSAVASSLPIVTIYENQQGKSRALNRALNRAEGEILVFTDDDVVPDPQWLVALSRASAAHPNANVFGGKVLLNYDLIPDWVANSYNLKTILASEQDFGTDIRWFGPNQYPVGPNLAVRKRALDSGRFNWPVNLGPGTKIPVGDERGFLMQVSPPRARDRLYVPNSIVRHNSSHTQISVTSAIKRCFLGGYAAGLMGGGREDSNIDHTQSAASLAWHRLRATASPSEIICVTARAFGVLAGTIIPFPRVVYG
jgi:glucosyl-dolichyl phosphate glucuronosyltransferase